MAKKFFLLVAFVLFALFALAISTPSAPVVEAGKVTVTPRDHKATEDPCKNPQNNSQCGQGDHGKGNPTKAHANCKAEQGEVDPSCPKPTAIPTTEPINPTTEPTTVPPTVKPPEPTQIPPTSIPTQVPQPTVVPVTPRPTVPAEVPTATAVPMLPTAVPTTVVINTPIPVATSIHFDPKPTITHTIPVTIGIPLTRTLPADPLPKPVCPVVVTYTNHYTLTFEWGVPPVKPQMVPVKYVPADNSPKTIPVTGGVVTEEKVQGLPWYDIVIYTAIVVFVSGAVFYKFGYRNGFKATQSRIVWHDVPQDKVIEQNLRELVSSSDARHYLYLPWGSLANDRFHFDNGKYVSWTADARISGWKHDLMTFDLKDVVKMELRESGFWEIHLGVK